MELGPGLWAHWGLEETSRKEGIRLTQILQNTESTCSQADLVVSLAWPKTGALDTSVEPFQILIHLSLVPVINAIRTGRSLL